MALNLSVAAPAKLCENFFMLLGSQAKARENGRSDAVTSKR